ncbi:hypothetical protein WJX73_010068 [Symbiochloris irregularis]|uniref:Carbonic anhydrase n=1 Tax=Symbiochloris irregularis TaxID=706552 RepID=A0AAW1NPL2_9CHLO
MQNLSGQLPPCRARSGVMADPRSENSALTANSSQLSTSPFAAQAKSPLDDDIDEGTSGVRFAPKHEVFHGNSRSLASSFNASTSPVERPSAAQKVDDRTRAAANEALAHLMEGNKRFLQGKFERCIPDLELLEEMRLGHYHPIAIVLGCSDARVLASFTLTWPDLKRRRSMRPSALITLAQILKQEARGGLTVSSSS